MTVLRTGAESKRKRGRPSKSEKARQDIMVKADAKKLLDTETTKKKRGRPKKTGPVLIHKGNIPLGQYSSASLVHIKGDVYPIASIGGLTAVKKRSWDDTPLFEFAILTNGLGQMYRYPNQKEADAAHDLIYSAMLLFHTTRQ